MQGLGGHGEDLGFHPRELGALEGCGQKRPDLHFLKLPWASAGRRDRPGLTWQLETRGSQGRHPGQ